MPHHSQRSLAPREMLRVMDAARVIHERKAALDEREAFDREATIREIQLMYEELGDLVDARTIEKALDAHLSRRYAFEPAPPGLRRRLALLYIARGWIAKRVLLPAAAAVVVVWGGVEFVEARGQRMQEAAQVRLATLEADVGRLHGAVLAAAVEDLARERAEDLSRVARSQIAAGDDRGLADTRRRYEELRTILTAEYRIVVTGGVWRYSTQIRNTRNNYLVVQALDSDGRPVEVPVRSEEDGSTRTVAEWGERVPREVYDRVAADKQDNGIIDDEAFGFKPRGYVTAERRHADIGQITEW